jgi:hypothetical protein
MQNIVYYKNNWGKNMNQNKQTEIVNIIEKFVLSGWDLIENPAKAWLKNQYKSDSKITDNLIEATEKANMECGSCGCEYDPLYKTILKSKDLLYKSA